MMAHVPQTYFKKGDSLSSTTYNDNVSKWNVTSEFIDQNNIRDQGLDMHCFDKDTAIDDHKHSLIKMNPEKKIDFVISPGSSSADTQIQLNFQYHWDHEYSQPNSISFFLPTKRFINLDQEMYAITSQVGDVTVAIHLTKKEILDRLPSSYVLTHVKNFRIMPQIKAVYTGMPSGVTPQLEITAYTASITEFKGGA